MPDKVNIANQALYLLGASRITDFTDETPEGEAVAEFYDSAKEAVLGEYAPQFAKKRASLAADATPPEWGYSNRFLLPSDFIGFDTSDALPDRMLGQDYEIEGQYLLIGLDGPLNITYTARTDEGLFSAMFVKALAAYLAVELAGKLPESRAKMGDMLTLYSQRLATGSNYDSRQRSTRQVKPHGRSSRVRHHYG